MSNEEQLKVFQFKFTDLHETKEKTIELYARNIQEARTLLEAWLKTQVMYKHDNGKYNSKRTKEMLQDDKMKNRLTMKSLKKEYKLTKLKFEK